MLELFDFTIYAYFAGTIGAVFFPKGSAATQLMLSFAVFGIGFLAKPLGSIVIGRLADRRGRRPALVLAIGLMAISTIGIGSVPPYAAIGVAAPLLVTIARAVQGFSSGGELTGSMAFLTEWAPPNRRGFFGAFQGASGAIGVLLGAVTASLVTSLMSADDVLAWGWRIPFWLGGVIAPVGLIIRLRVKHEAPAFRNSAAGDVAVLPVRDLRRNALKAFGFAIAATTAYYTFVLYMPMFLQLHAHLTRVATLLISCAALLFMAPTCLIAGALSDRIGRKAVLLTACAGMMILPYPLLKLVISGAGITTIVIVQFALIALAALPTGVGPSTLAEMFPTKQRATLMGIAYGCSTAIFGGFAPLICTFLIEKTANPLAPTLYLLLTAVVSASVILTLKETSRQPLA